MTVFFAIVVFYSCLDKVTEEQDSEKTGVRCILTSIEWDPVLPEIIVRGKVQRVGKGIPHIRGIETIHLDCYDAQGKRIHRERDVIFIPDNFINMKEIAFGISARVPKRAQFASIQLGSSGAKTQRMVIPKPKK